MKTSAFITMLLLIATALFSHPATSRYLAASASDQVQFVRNGLANGLWTEALANGHQRTYRFEPCGTANVLLRDSFGKTTIETYCWDAHEAQEEVLLRLSRISGERTEFKVNITCDGAILTALTTLEDYFLRFEPLLDELKLNLTKSTLTGDWTNVTQTDEAASMQTLKLSCNGTFVLQKEGQEKESGMWEVSGDGRKILFFITEAGSGHIVESKVMHILSLDEHGLTVQLPCNGKGESATFTFIQ